MRHAIRNLLRALGAALVVLGLGLGASGQTPNGKGPQPIAFYGEGCVLLQHGNVLRGFVKPHADRITITLSKGNEVTVPNRQILSVGPTMESLYAFQVRAIRKWGTGEHWHLAQWCIQNGLLDQAIEHYTELEKTASDSPKFKQLDLQLRQALLADAKVQQALHEQGIANPIVPASHEQIVEHENSDSSPALRHDDRDRGPARIVPGYLRRSFQTDVLPVIVSRCGQSGCHGMLAKNDFHVFQPIGEQAASISQKNLDGFMVYIDHADPTQTSLVQYAIRPHGSQRNPSIQPNRDEDRALMEKLVAWLQSLSAAEATGKSSHLIDPQTPAQHATPNRVAPAMALIPKHAVQQQMRKQPKDDLPEQDRNAKLSKPPKTGSPAVVLNAAELQEIEEAIEALEQKHAQKPLSKDPFDPAVFNAKYGSEKRGSEPK